jgi:hypothetical protein
MKKAKIRLIPIEVRILKAALECFIVQEKDRTWCHDCQNLLTNLHDKMESILDIQQNEEYKELMN